MELLPFKTFKIIKSDHKNIKLIFISLIMKFLHGHVSFSSTLSYEFISTSPQIFDIHILTCSWGFFAIDLLSSVACTASITIAQTAKPSKKI